MNTEETEAAAAVRQAFAAVCDAAIACRLADLHGTAVTDELRTAAHALHRLLAIIEGRA